MRATRTSLAHRAVAGAAALALALTPAVAAPTCPETSGPTSWSGSLLDTDTTKSGVVYDTSGARLELEPAAGTFTSVNMAVSDPTVFAAAADFDQDGWVDFVGAGEATSFVRIYENHTYENPEPDWDDPAAVREPKFVQARQLAAAVSSNRWRPVAAGDFNGDGWPDVFRASAPTGGRPDSAVIFLNNAANDASGYPTFAASYAAMATGSAPQDLEEQAWVGTNVVAVDYNGDRKLDLLVGNGKDNGTIRIFLNTCTLATPVVVPADPDAMFLCADAPKFSYSGDLITDMGFPSSARLPVFAYGDVNGDTFPDLVAGAPSCCTVADNRLRLWLGVSGGGLSTTPQSIAFDGGATVVFLADFSGDGQKDLIVGTDNFNFNSGSGANSFYWVNNGTATPFSDAPTQLTSHDDTNLPDFDVGFPFDYDHDPNNTVDLMIADGNHSTRFYIQANRTVAQYVTCGEVASGLIDLGPLASSEMVVTSARLKPVYELNGGSINFYMSNEDPPNWVLATACPDSSGDLCATFPRPVGREVRWKAEMCANSNKTQSPTLTSVDATFDYTEAREHFRAGAIVKDGVVYLGGFRQPGDRGHLFAVDAALSQTYWDVADGIDDASDSARNIFTADVTSTTRLPFTVLNATDPDLQTTLTAASSSQAAQVIDWVRSKRFGVGNTGIERSRLGAIETSTPSIMGPPGIPIWYIYASAIDQQRHTAFAAAHANRPTLLMFGAKDGMIHAVRSETTAMTVSPSGEEAWAYIPPKIASGMIADFTDSLTAGATQVSSYPDGSPTVADYRRSDGTWGTTAIVASGNGGKSVAAIDVTSTITSTGTVVGPTPMWNVVPGDADAGQANAKVAMARVLIAGTERYIAIAATGIAFDNPTAPYTKGRIVSAYDVATGEHLWKFQAQCAVTTDVTVFETDDELEPGAPTVNGFMDRVVFADACGYVYKLDPARDLDGEWNVNTGMGTIAIDDAGTAPDQVPQYALFSTELSANALGEASPIAGTLAVRADATTRVAIFFGTGGLENHPVSEANEFYAIYADNGAMRSKLAGACNSGRCEKFYGGAVVTADQVIITRTVDPDVASSSCDVGSTKVTGLDLDADADGDFTTDFETTVGSAVMGALYGDAGAVYFATLGGDLSRIGTPRAAAAGDDSTSSTPPSPYGYGNENSSADQVGTNTPLALYGWRQVY